MSDIAVFLGVIAWGVACWLGVAFVTVPLALSFHRSLAGERCA
jgi:hypothetical protein